MKRSTKLLSLITTLILLVVQSCKSDSIEKKMELLAPSTRVVGSEFYLRLQKQDYESAYNLFSEHLYKSYSRENIRILFTDIKGKYGIVKNAELTNLKLTTSLKDGEKQHLISNVYKVLYSSGFLAKEQLTFIVSDSTKSFNKVDGYSFEEYKQEE